MNATRNYVIELTADELKVIGECLMAGPYGRVAPLLENISTQIKALDELSAKEGEHAAT